MTDLTDRQKLVLRTIEAHIRKHGWAPTHRELATSLGMTQNGARDHIRALARKGYVEWRPDAARTLVVLRPSRRPATKLELRSDGGIPIVLGTARGPVRGVFWAIPDRNDGVSGEDRGGPVDIATGDRHAGP